MADFNVSALSEYIDQNSTELIGRLYFEGRTLNEVGSFKVGVKHKENIQLLDVAAYPQANSCSATASGDVTFDARTLTVGDVLYFSTLCPKTLKDKWTQKLLRTGARPEMEGLTFEAELANEIISTVQENNEKTLWQGDTTSGDPILSKWDGYNKIIDAAGTAVTGNTSGITSGTGITSGASGNADTIVYNMCDARPAALLMKPNQKLFMGTDDFNKLIHTLIQKNNFHIDATTYANYRWDVPGRNVEVVAVHGLNGTSRMFLGQADNFFVGIDGQNDDEVFDMWYEKGARKIYYDVEFKMGVQVARPSEIVQFTLA